MTPQEFEEFVAGRHHAVVATLRASGHPQMSNVVYAWWDGAFHVSVTESRAKTRNLRRDPRVAVHVTSDDRWAWVVGEGTAELSPLAAEPGDDVAMELRRIYEAVSGGPHEDWDEFDRAMVDEGRLVLTVAPEHTYGQV